MKDSLPNLPLDGGKDGIRTHDTVTRIHAFQSMGPRLEDNFSK